MHVQQSVGIARRAGRCGLMVAACLLVAGAARAAGVDPLTVEIDARDAQRFARLLDGDTLPTAEQLQRGYLDGAGRGVAIFMPGRIESARNLARAVAAEPQRYRYAITHCLPLLSALQADLRAIYLAYAGPVMGALMVGWSITPFNGEDQWLAKAMAPLLLAFTLVMVGLARDNFRSFRKAIAKRIVDAMEAGLSRPAGPTLNALGPSYTSTADRTNGFTTFVLIPPPGVESSAQ